MKTALITGITGQDGSYLCEHLLAQGYRIIGATRDVLNHSAMAASSSKEVKLVSWDLRDQRQIIDVISACRPNEIYNFAAYSSGSGMFEDPVGIGDINGIAVTRILEAIRTVDPAIRFCQASSSEMFGEPTVHPQNEDTPFKPRSPYGAAKLYAHSMLRIYRQRYGLFACSAILFNHESPRRGLGFVTRKICRAAAKIKLGLAADLHLGNLDVRRDWGFSGDYVRGMWQILQHTEADDFVLATGQLHTVRNLCDYAFKHVSLDYRKYVIEDPSLYRPAEPVPLVGDATKAQLKLGWRAEMDFRELVSQMVDSDLSLLANAPEG